MKVMLVDDQPRVLRATVKSVNWEKLGIEEVFTAESAEEAEEILEKEDIDIYLTDIEMPGEDGIALRTWQMEHCPNVLCIFLTSHDDFSYARQAVHDGVFDYLLQPARAEDIEEVISRAEEELRRRRRLEEKVKIFDSDEEGRTERFVRAIFFQRDRYQGMEDWIRDNHVIKGSCIFVPVLIISELPKERIRKEAEESSTLKSLNESSVYSALTTVGEGQTAMILSLPEREDERSLQEFLEKSLEKMRRELREKTGRPVTILAGDPAFEDLPDSAARLMDYSEKVLYVPDRVYFTGKIRPIDLPVPDGKVWGQWIERGDGILVRNQMNNLIRLGESQKNLTVSYLHRLMQSFMEAMTIALSRHAKTLSDLLGRSITWEEFLSSYEEPDDLLKRADLCLKRYDECFCQDQKNAADLSLEEGIRDVCRYVEEHIDENVTRRQAAKSLFISEDYFSRVFREKTGVGYKQYVVKVRIEYAKKLLQNTDLSVTMIASKVGYDSVTNFSDIFRKYTGCSPREFRKRGMSEKPKSE